MKKLPPVIDWTRPLRHFSGHGILEYLGIQKMRGGKPITDGVHHLVLIGNEKKAQYVDNYGRTHHPGKRPYQLIVNIAEPKKEPEPKKDFVLSEDLEEAVRVMIHESTDTIIDEVKGLKKVVHQWSEAAAKLNTELKTQIEGLRQMGRDQQDALLHANMMVLEELKKMLGTKIDSLPLPTGEKNDTPVVVPRRVTILPQRPEPEKVAPFPVDGQRIDFNAINKIECAELKTSLGYIMSNPLVSKVTIDRFDRRPTHTFMGSIKLGADNSFGIAAKGIDRFKAYELVIFLQQANDRNRGEIRQFVEQVNDYVKTITKAGEK